MAALRANPEWAVEMLKRHARFTPESFAPDKE